jgi:hypothetical protein
MTDSVMSQMPVAQFAPRQQRRNANDDRATLAAPRLPAHAKAEFARYRPHWRTSVAPLTFGIIVVVVLSIGWLNRDDGGLTPESGLGYWLGIVGASLMLLLLLYPLRKRVRALRALGSVAFWFRTHMILGIVGPELILLHANFRFGSINSNVAVVAMLIVAISGVVGRYLYGKIHLGLYGRKAQIQEILADVDALKGLIGSDLPLADHVVARLNALTQLGTNSPKGVLAGLFRLPVISMRAHAVRARLIADARRIIKVEGKRLGWSRRIRRRQLAGVVDLVTLHVAAVKKAAAFAFYERLFGLWHVFHLPLFFLLVTAAIIHVFAAHFF